MIYKNIFIDIIILVGIIVKLIMDFMQIQLMKIIGYVFLVQIIIAYNVQIMFAKNVLSSFICRFYRYLIKKYNIFFVIIKLN